MQDVGITLQNINVMHQHADYFGQRLKTLQVDHLVNLQQGAENRLSFSLGVTDGKTLVVN